MGFSGNLEDLPVVDVFHFLHVSRRTGRLTFDHPDHGAASFGLRDGSLVHATSPALGITVGKLLIEEHGVAEGAVREARAMQEEGDTRPIGLILAQRGQVSMQQVEAAMRRLIEKVVQHVLTWRGGSFAFELTSVTVSDDIACFPESVRPNLTVDVQGILLEALRLMDEQARREPTPVIRELPSTSVHLAPASAGEPRPDEATRALPGASDVSAAMGRFESERHEAPRVLVVLGSEGYLKYMLKDHWRASGIATRVCTLEREAHTMAERLLDVGSRVVFAVDLDADAASRVRRVEHTTERFPSCPVLAFGAHIDRDTLRSVTRAGARLVLQRPQRATGANEAEFAAFLDDLLAAVEGAFPGRNDQRALIDECRAVDLERVAAAVERLRQGGEHASMSLTLMEYVAQSTQRAILFFCRSTDLLAIGSFGHPESQENSLQAGVGLRLAVDDLPTVRRVLASRKSIAGRMASQPGMLRLYESVGAPVTGEGLWVPVATLERVVAVLYADNGTSYRPLVRTEALEILASTVGLMLENLALRRRA